MIFLYIYLYEINAIFRSLRVFPFLHQITQIDKELHAHHLHTYSYCIGNTLLIVVFLDVIVAFSFISFRCLLLHLFARFYFRLLLLLVLSSSHNIQHIQKIFIYSCFISCFLLLHLCRPVVVTVTIIV